MPNSSPSPQEARGSIQEVLLVFLRLGCTSFGGACGASGYFQKEIVERLVAGGDVERPRQSLWTFAGAIRFADGP